MLFFAPLARRPIAFLWGSQLLTSTAEELYRVAMFWLAATLVGSAAGYIAATQQLMVFAVGLFGGVLVDRWNSRKAMVSVDIVRALALLVIPGVTLIWGVQLWTLFFVAAIVWGARGVHNPALQAVLPRIEPSRDVLLALNGLLDTTKRLARILGPGMAGGIALFVPIEQFFTVIAGIFALSAVAVAALKSHMPQGRPPPIPGARRGIAGLIEDFVAGVRTVRGHRLMVWSFHAVWVTNVLWTMAFTLGIVLLVQEKLPGHLGAYGLIVAAYGVGNLAGNFILASLRYGPQIWCVFPGRIVLGLGFFGMAFVSDVPLLMLSAGIAAVGGTMGDLPFLALMQREFNPSQIGRIYGLKMTIESAGGVVGALAAAPLLGAFSAATVVGGAGVTLIAFGALTAWLTRADIAKRIARDPIL
ncbi:MAG: MFS transporter [Rhodospirillales bacterium]|nr:MFS transporter [Rhodospirillales bacterium]